MPKMPTMPTMPTMTTSPFDEFDGFDQRGGDQVMPTLLVGQDVDIERLSTELGDLAEGHMCAVCRDDPGHRFELLRTLGARLQPEARDRLELIALAGHLAWPGRPGGHPPR